MFARFLCCALCAVSAPCLASVVTIDFQRPRDDYRGLFAGDVRQGKGWNQDFANSLNVYFPGRIELVSANIWTSWPYASEFGLPFDTNGDCHGAGVLIDGSVRTYGEAVATSIDCVSQNQLTFLLHPQEDIFGTVYPVWIDNVTLLLEGDADGDADIDLDDLNAVRNNFGGIALGGGDTDNDGDVDLDDLNAVRNGFGAGPLPVTASAAVPEPSSLALGLLIAIALHIVRRGRLQSR